MIIRLKDFFPQVQVLWPYLQCQISRHTTHFTRQYSSSNEQVSHGVRGKKNSLPLPEQLILIQPTPPDLDPPQTLVFKSAMDIYIQETALKLSICITIF